MTEITITSDDLETVVNEGLEGLGTVLVLTGTDTATGQRVTFAGDARPMSDLINGVLFSGSETASVESWQILRRL